LSRWNRPRFSAVATASAASPSRASFLRLPNPKNILRFLVDAASIEPAPSPPVKVEVAWKGRDALEESARRLTRPRAS